ncbi:hypothetical protein ROZALSC1DRAFT_28702 [Rozella allomycis CSF55]|uniref:Uncharacterized protein n=1 Tax=Rozella allomycis (strain CSF55) TaxID=988480 RepID=A0A4P9YJF8_ROZAC|nr:hypothetical protein ROZALSC1DRAFT_28702 [Rozella allomycis CSF55]
MINRNLTDAFEKNRIAGSLSPVIEKVLEDRDMLNGTRGHDARRLYSFITDASVGSGFKGQFCEGACHFIEARTHVLKITVRIIEPVLKQWLIVIHF